MVKVEPEPMISGLANRACAVSYTHLDVYKRQHEGVDSIAAKGSAQTAMWQVNIVAVGSSVTVWLCLK